MDRVRPILPLNDQYSTKESDELANGGMLKFIGMTEKIEGEVARVKVFPEFCEGLAGLGGYSHIIILYWFHLRDNNENRRTLRVIPKKHLGTPEVGVFACRSPSRPNPIGFCVSELLRVEDCTLIVRELDAIEGTPIVDIKPYLPRADCIPQAKAPEWTLRGPKT